MWRKPSNRISAVILAFAMAVSLVVPSSATDKRTPPFSFDDKTNVYYETENFFNSSEKYDLLCKANDSWAIFSPNESLTTANIHLLFNGYNYIFKVQGDVVEVGSGHVGSYQGYITPDPNDTLLSKQLEPGAPGVLVSADVVYYEDEIFFTLIMGILSETQTPIVKAYGTHTDSINEVARAYADYFKSAHEPECELQEIPILGKKSNLEPQSVDAATRLQGYTDFLAGTTLVGQVSLFHADELRNQGSTSVFAKVNSNTAGANNYARNYFNLSSNDLSAAYPKRVDISLASNDGLLHIDGENYSPKTVAETLELQLPFVSSGFDSISATEVSITVSTVDAETNGGRYGNQNANWIFSHLVGMTGMNGTYSSQKGLSTFASYKYEDNVTSERDRTITATARIQYVVYVENASTGTTHSYSFTTATRSTTGEVTILP